MASLVPACHASNVYSPNYHILRAIFTLIDNIPREDEILYDYTCPVIMSS